MSFRRLSDHELDALEDDGLIAYIRSAHRVGETAAGQRGLGILVYGHWPNVERRVRMKVPEAEVEDLTGDIITMAFESAFDGTSVGEFVSWLRTITQRRIADHYRRGRGGAKTTPTDAGDDEATMTVELVDPGHGDYVEVVDVIDDVLGGLASDHRRVVELVVFEDRTAREAAESIAGMTEANAYQVVSRFRRDLRVALDDDGPSL